MSYRGHWGPNVYDGMGRDRYLTKPDLYFTKPDPVIRGKHPLIVEMIIDGCRSALLKDLISIILEYTPICLDASINENTIQDEKTLVSRLSFLDDLEDIALHPLISPLLPSSVDLSSIPLFPQRDVFTGEIIIIYHDTNHRAFVLDTTQNKHVSTTTIPTIFSLTTRTSGFLGQPSGGFLFITNLTDTIHLGYSPDGSQHEPATVILSTGSLVDVSIREDVNGVLYLVGDRLSPHVTRIAWELRLSLVFF